jgi:hypothetical protein
MELQRTVHAPLRSTPRLVMPETHWAVLISAIYMKEAKASQRIHLARQRFIPRHAMRALAKVAQISDLCMNMAMELQEIITKQRHYIQSPAI